MLLPGRNTIPDQIVDNRQPYFAALEEADRTATAGSLDLTRMEDLIEGMLARQLASVLESATGKHFLSQDEATD